MLRRLSIAVLGSLALACGKDEGRLIVAVDGTSFTRLAVPSGGGGLATVPFDVTNRGNATAFVATCGSAVIPVVEQLVGSKWEQYAGGICLQNIGIINPTPIAIREGESQRAVVAISDPGRFRLRVLYSHESARQPTTSAASRAFDIR